MPNLLKSWFQNGHTKKILLLRHGRTQTATDAKRFVGQTDLPLSDLGRHQARCWRECLTDLPLARIVASDLSRCMETATIIAADRYRDILPLAGLREIHLGQWDGLSFGEVNERWPDDFQQRGKEMARFRPPAGESFLDLQQRVVPVFQEMVDQADKNILIVAHAGVNRMILCHLLGMPPENLFRIAQGWGALNLIDRKADGYRVESLNLLPG